MTFMTGRLEQIASCVRRMRRYATAAVLTLTTLCLMSNLAHAGEFRFSEGNPVFPSRGTKGFDSKYIDPGAMTIHDGMFHMLYPALPSWPHPLAVGYATSEDGVHWHRESDEPVFRIEDTGMDGYGVMASSVMVTDEGKWVLYFTLVPEGRNFTGSIGRATADSPAGPWTTDEKLLLTPGPDGAWDAIAIGNASVVSVPDGYLMFYTGIGSYDAGAFTENHQYIGLARSSDGVNWEKFDDPATVDAHHVESDPVLRADTDDDTAWDSYSLSDTNVQRVGDGFRMFYRGSAFSGGASIGLATSSDGVVWQRAQGDPVITNQMVGAKINFVSYVRHNDTDFVYLEAGASESTDVVLMVKPD